MARKSPVSVYLIGCVFVALSSASLLCAKTDFAKDIQPIFARNCYECHGPEKQKGKLRLDDRNAVFKESAVIVPGDASKSELYRRVTLPKGHDDIMPNRGEPLSPSESASIRSWIDEGAIWPDNLITTKHWAYVSPKRPALPKVKNLAWAKNEIDRFVLARLEKEQMHSSSEADRERLLRRVHLDLIGLPPSPQEIQSFLADKSPAAYDTVVQRLLASPHYGERWARPWLDLARYADSIGFQRDDLWEIWPYRDWVIRAFNADMPFDQFTIEQIAGDLMPNPTASQKVATGFNRCTATNLEAGSDQEETRVNQVFDRVNTLGTIWLGSTLECAQCHNHKYDPFSQKEYFQLFAFFNNTVQETDFRTPKATAALRFLGPYLSLPDMKIEKQRAGLEIELARLDQQIKGAGDELLASQPAWESTLANQLSTTAKIHTLEITDFEADSDSLHEILPDKSILLRANDNAAIPQKDTYTITTHAKLEGITAFRLDVLTDPSLPGTGPGRGDGKNPNFVLTAFSVTVAPQGQNKFQSVKFRNARASFEQKKFRVGDAIDSKGQTGWAINPEFFKDHWAIFETTTPIGLSKGETFVFKLEQNYGGGRTIGRLRLSAVIGTSDSDALPADIATIIQTPPAKRSKAQQKRLTDFHHDQKPELAKMKAARSEVARQLKNLQPPRTLVMQEMDTSRQSTMFVRGSFLEKGEAVQPGVPTVLHSFSAAPADRLALARWVVSTNNPLVARVTVNRWWMEFFGHGLVTTPEDFGVKGELPTHAELLDWLSVEFMERGWSMKHIHQLIVSSATYRQTANVSDNLSKLDDQNKLYARGPRFRMDAEMIRDNALATAGLLSLKLGGPPVRPYQPPGLWEKKVGGEAITYELSEGEDRYRRGIYTVWKRTSPYPSFITFDAPNRNACVVRRPRSNTPLQSLTLLNDPVYVEASKVLAKRVLSEKGAATTKEKIRYAFQLCVARTPTARELEILTNLYEDQLRASRLEPAIANKLFHDFPKPDGVDAAEFAAWYNVASALLNLDETITKG